jgi:hypothetical protein
MTKGEFFMDIHRTLEALRDQRAAIDSAISSLEALDGEAPSAKRHTRKKKGAKWTPARKRQQAEKLRKFWASKRATKRRAGKKVAAKKVAAKKAKKTAATASQAAVGA